MIGFFNVEIDDGNVEEVAEQLMVIDEECLQGRTDFIEKLRQISHVTGAASQSRQVAEQLMVIHEECLQGRTDSIEKLRQIRHVTGAASQSRQVLYVEGEGKKDDTEKKN